VLHQRRISHVFPRLALRVYVLRRQLHLPFEWFSQTRLVENFSTVLTYLDTGLRRLRQTISKNVELRCIFNILTSHHSEQCVMGRDVFIGYNIETSTHVYIVLISLVIIAACFSTQFIVNVLQYGRL